MKILASWRGAALALLLIVGTPSPVRAYDIDTHFYLTFAAMLSAGLDPSIAAHFATGAEYLDESPVTKPTGGLILGTAWRRLYHFGASRRIPLSTAAGWSRFSFLTQSTEDHAIMSTLFMEGLKTGNFQLVSAALHALEDGFGHAGFFAESGHIETGHWPDRPWVEIPKYERMIRTIFKAIVALREVLPDSALDSASPGVKKTAAQLADEFIQNPDFNHLWNNNYLTDPRYTRFAVEHVLQVNQKDGYLRPEVNVDDLLAQNQDFFQGGKTGQEILTGIIERLAFGSSVDIGNIFNLPAIFKDSGEAFPFGRVSKERIILEFGRGRIVRTFVRAFSHGHIPEGFSDSNKVAAEFEGPIRKREMALRIDDWRAKIFSKWNLNLVYVPKSGLDTGDTQNSVPRIEAMQVGFTGPERVKWAMSHLKYTFLQMHLQPSDDAFIYRFPDEFREMIQAGEVQSPLSQAQINALKARYVCKLALN